MKLSQILETKPGWSSSMRTATGPQKGRLTVVSMVLPRRAKDYLANRAPLAVAPFKATKTERERIAVELFQGSQTRIRLGDRRSQELGRLE